MFKWLICLCAWCITIGDCAIVTVAVWNEQFTFDDQKLGNETEDVQWLA